MLKLNDVVLDPKNSEVFLLVNNNLVPINHLPPQQMELVIFLYTKEDSTATKSEIMEHLWPSGYISNESFSQLLSKTRMSLKDKNKTALTYNKSKGYTLHYTEFTTNKDDSKESIKTESRNKKSSFITHNLAMVKKLNISSVILVIILLFTFINALILTNIHILTPELFNKLVSENIKSQLVVKGSEKSLLIKDSQGEQYQCSVDKNKKETICERKLQ